MWEILQAHIHTYSQTHTIPSKFNYTVKHSIVNDKYDIKNSLKFFGFVS